MNILRNFSRSEGAVEFIGGIIAFSLKLGDVTDFILIEVEIFGGILWRWLSGEVIDEKILIKIGKMKLDVDAIKNWATEMFGVIVNLSGGTGAGFNVWSIIATRAGIHGGEEREIGGECGALFGARNRDLVVFEWLA